MSCYAPDWHVSYIMQGSYAVIKSHKVITNDNYNFIAIINGSFFIKAIKSHTFSRFLFLLSGLQLKTHLFVFTRS